MSNVTLKMFIQYKTRKQKYKHTTAGSEKYSYDSFVLKCIVRYDNI